MAANTRALVSGLTYRDLLMTCETVAVETPAAFAMSWMVVSDCLHSDVRTIP